MRQLLTMKISIRHESPRYIDAISLPICAAYTVRVQPESAET